jgi:hypothetical protein
MCLLYGFACSSGACRRKIKDQLITFGLASGNEKHSEAMATNTSY